MINELIGLTTFLSDSCCNDIHEVDSFVITNLV